MCKQQQQQLLSLTSGESLWSCHQWKGVVALIKALLISLEPIKKTVAYLDKKENVNN